MSIKGITGKPRTLFMIACGTYRGSSSHGYRTAVLINFFIKAPAEKSVSRRVAMLLKEYFVMGESSETLCYIFRTSLNH